MAKETKTVQCYPDDNKINRMTDEYGSFGWELIGNQRCREEGAYVVSTFNKLTFSREKSAPWYSEVVELESRYKSYMDKEPENFAIEPSKKWLIYGILGVIIGATIWLALGGMIGFFAMFTIVPVFAIIGIGAILLAIFIIKRIKYNKKYNYYLYLRDEWKRTSKKEADEIRKKAEALVNAN